MYHLVFKFNLLEVSQQVLFTLFCTHIVQGKVFFTGDDQQCYWSAVYYYNIERRKVHSLEMPQTCSHWENDLLSCLCKDLFDT